MNHRAPLSSHSMAPRFVYPQGSHKLLLHSPLPTFPPRPQGAHAQRESRCSRGASIDSVLGFSTDRRSIEAPGAVTSGFWLPASGCFGTPGWSQVSLNVFCPAVSVLQAAGCPAAQRSLVGAVSGPGGAVGLEARALGPRKAGPAGGGGREAAAPLRSGEASPLK